MIKFRKSILILGLALALNLNQFTYADILDDIIEVDNEQNQGNEQYIETQEDLENQKTEENIEVEENQEPSATTETRSAIKSYEVVLSDISGHWAESRIKEAIKLGFVSGYSDGTFKPDKTITRAEFATLLNNAMNIENTISINLSDVHEKDWYYDQVKKSVAVGFFSGYQDNTFRPNNPITRQEAAKVINGAITAGNIDGDGAINLTDYNSIQEWAKSSVNLAYNKSYIMGYPDKTYKPSRSLTRAEAIKIIYEILDNENIEHGFNITNYNELYSGAVVVGDLNILNSVGNGNVYLTNVTVLGNINVFAENANSIVLTDIKARNIVVECSKPVKITCNDNIYIENAKLSANSSVEKIGSNIQINNTVFQ